MRVVSNGCRFVPPYTRGFNEPGGLPPIIRILPSVPTTVAALLRAEVSGVPGNHVSGAADKLAPKRRQAAVPMPRRRDLGCVQICSQIDFALGPAIPNSVQV